MRGARRLRRDALRLARPRPLLEAPEAHRPLLAAERPPRLRHREQREALLVADLQVPLDDQLVDPGAHRALGDAGEQAEDRELLVAEAAHLLGVAAAQHLGHVRRAERVAAAPGRADDLARGHQRLVRGQLGGLAEADVAGAAPGGPVLQLVAEVLDEDAVAADRRHGEAADVRELAVEGDAALRRQRAVQLRHPPVAEEVPGARQQHALGRQAVAPGAARLLLVVLERARQVRVDDEAHVRAVDPHAEGDRRRHHLQPLVDEVVLDAARARPRPCPAWYGRASTPAFRSASAMRSVSLRVSA